MQFENRMAARNAPYSTQPLLATIFCETVTLPVAHKVGSFWLTRQKSSSTSFSSSICGVLFIMQDLHAAQKAELREESRTTSKNENQSLTSTFLNNAPSDSILLFSAAMAQIKIPKTALATTSAIEYPICSPAVAVTPEIPSILMMYTKG